MIRPRPLTITFQAITSPPRLFLLFAALLLTCVASLVVPQTFESCLAVLCDDDEDDGPTPQDEVAQISSLSQWSPPTAAHLRPSHRHHPGRGLRPHGGGRPGHTSGTFRRLVVTPHTPPLPPAPGGEHSRRNGLGAPLRC